MTPANPFASVPRPAGLDPGSSEHTKALKAALDWYAGKERPPFRLFGPAGTGKTTLARTIASAIGGNILFAAFSGKAASVMRQKGCENATTIHKLIYTPTKDPTGKIRFVLNENSPLNAATLLIVDESSNVDAKLAHDLMSFNKPIIVLGDPAQLPPVAGKGAFTNGPPDTLLSEIHRQDKDSPIIKLATAIRTGSSIVRTDHSPIISIHDLTPDMILEADQILVGRNTTRHRYNARVRELLGRRISEPIVGDKLVCLKNQTFKQIFNGEIWFVEEIHESSPTTIQMTVRPEIDDGRRPLISVRREFFIGAEDTIPIDQRDKSDEFSFGNVLTVHKAQGSEWKSVLVFDESETFGENRATWLYTAVTRASEKLTLVRQ